MELKEIIYHFLKWIQNDFDFILKKYWYNFQKNFSIHVRKKFIGFLKKKRKENCIRLIFLIQIIISNKKNTFSSFEAHMRSARLIHYTAAVNFFFFESVS